MPLRARLARVGTTRRSPELARSSARRTPVPPPSSRAAQVFYTLNGRYLGVAFTANAQQLPLHPIVGIDTHAEIAFNFGQRPFEFDTDALPPPLNMPIAPRKPSPLRQLATAAALIASPLTRERSSPLSHEVY